MLEGAFSAIIPFVAVLNPAPVRATGVGWAGGAGRLGTAMAPLYVGLLVKKKGVAFAVVPLAAAAFLAALSIIVLRPRRGPGTAMVS